MARSKRLRGLYSTVCQLPLSIDTVTFELQHRQTRSGWTRYTTTVHLHGGGCSGRGEDVTYDADLQRSFAASKAPDLAGRYESFSAFSRRLDRAGTFFDGVPPQASSVLYRRWAFESAGLDLALRQAKTSLAELWAITPEPVRFVVSTGLGNPASTSPLRERLAVKNDLAFKVDYSETFTDALILDLAAFDIACIDFKGHYHGAFSGPPVDKERYRAVADAFPGAILEDPGFAGLASLQGETDRLSWDYPVCSVADLLQLPPTGYVNIKPSRFGLLSELLRAIEYCRERGITLYGGGQFELGVGRSQAQELAALFYPNGPNDLAPSEYNEAALSSEAPSSPLRLSGQEGFGLKPA